MSWQLRRATESDLDGIMAIEHSEFANDAWSSDMMRAEIRDNHGYYVIAHPVGEPTVVTAYAGLRSPFRSPQADIQTIAVSSDARRQGIGRALMHALMVEARDRGASELFLEVRDDNPSAQRLYDSLGFERIAVRPNYYQPDGVDAIVMRLTIPEPKLSPAVGA
ncbi:ribosomal protein S18-alanine N-acetyltransferase [Salinibacterium sp. NSLL150]|uniref:ribosomal protein S18-alanine N-acetyltransferase n=1 Tax=unclassified Salinibacterium TaxID=2632331 RepID=UPI0018CD611E|nr:MULTISPECIES: ribosomal protein S18-alanine N-acetyltransferase [unclassified Salinibacterium]MBH0023295.1 ribosomal protein S18-alanine N-acetyltransferase [Salinibacterium sp. SWN248]MBH0098280.1 ribosomal protein S18-alanine N-acetyltransferase [Salinibacterium sp. NSLL35]MBH0101035.1 ribosomal protein S18-alanine N-acetyltransferase [Salinibacterium sp. NSLL150]MBH0103794.1 ribosomal protein S18-alanine N-acetyltransferase [Salinibacterium sp. NSLL16]MBH0106555.1 ribosomal protein S18-a